MNRFLVAMVFCCVTAGLAYSQTSNASLGGTVTDASGAYIPGVTITANNTNTGIANTTITNEAGAYNFPVCKRELTRCRRSSWAFRRRGIRMSP
jgi:hypothetical protein